MEQFNSIKAKYFSHVKSPKVCIEESNSKNLKENAEKPAKANKNQQNTSKSDNTEPQNISLSFCNVTITPSIFSPSVTQGDLLEFANPLIENYVEFLDKDSLKQNESQSPQTTLSKTLESSLPITKQRIYNTSVSKAEQLHQILQILKMPPMDINFMRENSSFTCFTTVDGLEFESEPRSDKKTAKECMSGKIVKFLDKKYGKLLTKN